MSPSNKEERLVVPTREELDAAVSGLPTRDSLVQDIYNNTMDGSTVLTTYIQIMIDQASTNTSLDEVMVVGKLLEVLFASGLAVGLSIAATRNRG